MKLRVRLAVATLVGAIPLVALGGWLGASLRVQAAEEMLGEHALAVLTSGRSACEADPEGWRGWGAPGVVLQAFGPELRGSRGDAPDASLVAALAHGRASASRVVGGAVEVLVRAPWGEGPCGYVLARRLSGAPGRAGGPPWLVLPLVCIAVVLGLVVLLLGPLVRRIRRLRDEVRRTADAAWRGAVTVSGDDELTELAAAFAEASRQLVAHVDAHARRERTLREFLANTTHDVMMPLTVLQGHLAALDGPAAGPELRAAMQEVDYVVALVHNLGVAATLEAGEPALTRAPVDLVVLLGRVRGRHAPLARRRGVELVQAVPERSVVVLGDVTAIEQAVNNLVHNAVLYNHDGGHVALVLDVEGAHRFSIAVRDDGPGLSGEVMARVSERGERGDAARTRHPHGLGLGLAIARRVAEAHGWAFELRGGAEGGLEVELRGAIAAGGDR